MDVSFDLCSFVRPSLRPESTANSLGSSQQSFDVFRRVAAELPHTATEPPSEGGFDLSSASEMQVVAPGGDVNDDSFGRLTRNHATRRCFHGGVLLFQR